MAEIIAYTIQIKGQKVAIDSQNALINALERTNKVLRDPAVKLNSAEYKQLNTILATLKNTQQAIRNETKRVQNELILSATVPKGSYNDLKNELRKLTSEYKEFSDDLRSGDGAKELVKRVSEINREIKELDNNLKRVDVEADSLDGLRQRANELRRSWARMSKETREGLGGQQLKTELDSVNESIRQITRSLNSVSHSSGSLNQLNAQARTLRERWAEMSRETRNGVGGQRLARELTATNEIISRINNSLIQLGSANNSLNQLRARANQLRASFASMSEELRNGVKGRELARELALVNNEIKAVNNSLNRFDESSTSINALNRRVRELREEFTKMSKEAREGIGGQSIAREISRLDSEIKKANRSLASMSDSIGSLNQLQRRASELREEWARMSRVMRQGIDGVRLKEELNDVEKEIRQVTNELRGIENNAGSLNELQQRASELRLQWAGLSKVVRESGFGEKLAKELNEVNAEIRKINKSLEGTRDAQGSINQLRKRAQELRTELNSLSKSARDSDVGRNLAKELKQVEREAKQATDAIKQVGAQDGSYRQLQARIAALSNEYRELGTSARRGTRANEIKRELRVLNAEIRTIDKSIGSFRTNIGNYGSAFSSAFRGLSGILAAAGIHAGLSEIIDFAQESIRVFREFSQEQATVAAVSGATGEQLVRLAENARDVGSSTQFTATQVSELQTSFARLGFSANEILNATSDTASLAIATGEDIGKSAKVIGQSVRAYGLEASQAGEIADILTAAFNSSALQLETFSEANKLLAPTARSLGVPIAEATAAIGLLADSGLEGTIATQTISSSLIRLSDETKKYGKAAKEAGVEVFDQNGEFVGLIQLVKNLQEATKDLTEEERLATIGRIVGVQSARNFNLLLGATRKQVDEFSETTLVGGDALSAYTRQLRRSAGEAKRTADVVGDTLNQDILKLTSAWEALRISLVGAFEEGLRGATQGLTALVQTLDDLFRIPLSEKLEDERIRFIALTTALQDNNIRSENRAKIIEQLRAQFPEHIKGIQLETATSEQLAAVLNRVNDSYREKIELQVRDEALTEKLEEKQAALNQENENTKVLYEALIEARKVLGDETIQLSELETRLEEKAIRVKNGKHTVLNEEAKLLVRVQGALSSISVAEAQGERLSKEVSDLRAKRLETQVRNAEQEELRRKLAADARRKRRLEEVEEEGKSEAELAERKKKIQEDYNSDVKSIEADKRKSIFEGELELAQTEEQRVEAIKENRRREQEAAVSVSEAKIAALKKSSDNERQVEKAIAKEQEEQVKRLEEIKLESEQRIIKEKLKNSALEESEIDELEVSLKRVNKLLGNDTNTGGGGSVVSSGGTSTGGGGGTGDDNDDVFQSGSIKAIQEQISDLNKELESSSDENIMRDKLLEIIELEDDLEAAKDKLEDMRLELSGEAGSIDGLRQSISRLNSEISRETDENIIREKVKEVVELEEDLERMEKTVRRFRSEFSQEESGERSANDIRGRISQLNSEIEDETDQNIIRDKLVEIAELQDELRDVLFTIEQLRKGISEEIETPNPVTVPFTTDQLNDASQFNVGNEQQESNNEELENELKRIEFLRQRRIQSAIEQGGTLAEITKNLRKIELQSDLEVLKAKEQAEADFSAKKIQLANEVSLAQKAIDDNDAQEAVERRNKVIAQIQAALQNVSQLISAVDRVRQNRAEAEINDIRDNFDERIEREREAGAEEVRIAEQRGEDTEAIQERVNARIVTLERERDAQIEEVQRESFERGKRLQIAQAIISGAQGILSVIAAVPGPLNIASLGVARLALIGLTIATTAAQIAAISSQEFALGGMVNGPPHSRGGVKARVQSTGQRVELEGDEAIINRRSMASNEVISVSGTPKQIASAINALDNNGVSFATGATVVRSKSIEGVNINEINHAFAGLVGNKYYNHYEGNETYNESGLNYEKRQTNYLERAISHNSTSNHFNNQSDYAYSSYNNSVNTNRFAGNSSGDNHSYDNRVFSRYSDTNANNDYLVDQSKKTRNNRSKRVLNNFFNSNPFSANYLTSSYSYNNGDYSSSYATSNQSKHEKGGIVSGSNASNSNISNRSTSINAQNRDKFSQSVHNKNFSNTNISSQKKRISPNHNYSYKQAISKYERGGLIRGGTSYGGSSHNNTQNSSPQYSNSFSSVNTRFGFAKNYASSINTLYFENGGIVSSSNIPSVVASPTPIQSTQKQDIRIELSPSDIDAIREAVFDGAVEGTIVAAQEANRLNERMRKQKRQLTK